MSDDDIIRQREEIARQARDPNNIRVSVDQIKDLGRNAIATDGAFVTISRTFEAFVRDYGSQFPALSQFLTRWQGYHATWKTILQQSRDFATTTSGEYKRYDQVYLRFLQELETKEQLEEAIGALTQFSENTSTYIPIDFANKFKDLGEEVKAFRDDFDRYLIEQGKELTARVKELQRLLAEAEKTVKDCQDLLDQASILVGFIPIVGYFAGLVTELLLPGVVLRRNRAAEAAKGYEKEIQDANQAQEGLARMQTQFAALDSDFQIICDGLVVFAQTWAYFHAESKKFADALKGINDVKDIPETFKSAVDLARAIATPLEEGLDAYATVIAEP
jgi:hypothetical protein